MLNMKNFIKNLLKNGSLYKKELNVICAILLCFTISGICLPVVKNMLPVNESAEDQTTTCKLTVKESDTQNLEYDASKTKKATSKKAASESTKKSKNEEQAKNKNTKKTTEEATNSQDSKDPKITEEAKESKNITATDNSQNDSSPGTSPQTPATDNSGSTSSGNTPTANPAPPSTPAAPPEPEKVWVPPVYTTVHHEAVYETIQSVCCNYCGATFGSVGEFQVHKDANGG